MEADIGTESEYESGMDDLSTIEDTHRDQRQERAKISMERQSHRIFKFLQMQNPNVTLPAQKPAKSAEIKKVGPLTIFIELEEVFMYGFIVDQHFGYMAKPTAKDPEHEVFIEDTRETVLVYLRDNVDLFLDYLREQKPDIETVLYTKT